MATFERHVDVDWKGSVTEGKGEAKAGTGAFSLPVSFPSRIGDPGGKTSPEELMAAAHAACYAMAFSHALAEAGHAPERLSVDAACQLDPVAGGGVAISRIDLSVRGRVPGLDQAEFEQLAADGERGCPVSNALRGNVEIGLAVTLET